MAAKTARATSPAVPTPLAIVQIKGRTDVNSSGLFAGTIGVRRLLRMFEKYNIKTTWVPRRHHTL